MHGRDNKKAGSMGCRTPQSFCGRFNFCVPVIRMLVRLTFRGTRVVQWCEHFLPTIVFLVLVLTPYVGWVFCQRGSSFALKRFLAWYLRFPLSPKLKFPNSNLTRKGRRRTTMWMCYLHIGRWNVYIKISHWYVAKARFTCNSTLSQKIEIFSSWRDNMKLILHCMSSTILSTMTHYTEVMLKDIASPCIRVVWKQHFNQEMRKLRRMW